MFVSNVDPHPSKCFYVASMQHVTQATLSNTHIVYMYINVLFVS